MLIFTNEHLTSQINEWITKAHKLDQWLILFKPVSWTDANGNSENT